MLNSKYCMNIKKHFFQNKLEVLKMLRNITILNTNRLILRILLLQNNYKIIKMKGSEHKKI